MEKLLVIFIFASSVMAEPFIKSCGNFSLRTSSSRDEDVDTRNNIRKGLMKAVNISNMFELKYNPNLEDELRKMKSCDDINHGPNFRVDLKPDEKVKTFLQKLAKAMKLNILYVGMFHTSAIEYFHPGQSFIAWCDLNVKCKEEYVDDKNEKQSIETDKILIYGPMGTYSESDFKFGEPGSDCPNGVVTPPCEWSCELCEGPEVPVKTTTPSKEMSAGNSIDADSAAPFASVVLIYSIILLVNIVNVY
ncbi:hypothetical protein CAEBREN_03821 [Caenorhabditis brenneri]|uniref:SCP domain-containing protein n=1 Tax=Caenorhabditis brenneri TaxID=135651 RepID=G0NPJ9_CAEBE|nr:hypothetical protein CAEBREN_03821 [Caenorhabditis brenneri]